MYGEIIKTLRERKGIKQGILAEAIGIPQSTLSFIENSQYPPIEQIKKVCDYFEIQLSEYFSIVEEKKNIPEIYFEIAQAIEDLPDDTAVVVLEHVLSEIRFCKKLVN